VTGLLIVTSCIFGVTAFAFQTRGGALFGRTERAVFRSPDLRTISSARPRTDGRTDRKYESVPIVVSLDARASFFRASIKDSANGVGRRLLPAIASCSSGYTRVKTRAKRREENDGRNLDPIEIE